LVLFGLGFVLVLALFGLGFVLVLALFWSWLCFGLE